MSSSLDLESEGQAPNDHLRVPTIDIDSRYYVTLMARALEKEVDALEKLGKKMGDEGRPNEQRSLYADAAAIKDRIIPRMKEQLPIQFPTFDQVEKMIRGELWPFANHAFSGLDKIENLDTLRDTMNKRKEVLVREIAQRFVVLSARAAQIGYDLGHQAYQTTPQRVVHAALTEQASDV
jgi:hypothetical protein